MKWFKHMSDAHDDEALSAVIDEFGLSAYGAYWIIVEMIASQSDGDKCEVTYSWKKVRRFLGVNRKTAEKWFNRFSTLRLLSIKVSQEAVTIECRKLLIIRDEWSRKRMKTPEPLGSDSGPKKRREEDKDKEEEVDPPPPRPHTNNYEEQLKKAGGVCNTEELKDDWALLIPNIIPDSVTLLGYVAEAHKRYAKPIYPSDVRKLVKEDEDERPNRVATNHRDIRSL